MKMLINHLKCPICLAEGRKISDPESISGNKSSPEVNRLFRFVSQIITSSFDEIS